MYSDAAHEWSVLIVKVKFAPAYSRVCQAYKLRRVNIKTVNNDSPRALKASSGQRFPKEISRREQSCAELTHSPKSRN